MTPAKQLRYLVLLVVALVLAVKAASVAFTPDLYLALRIVAQGVISNVIVQALLITLALVGLVSMCAAAWDRADRRYRNTGRKAA